MPNICIVLCDDGELLGWVGLRPMYEPPWELHSLVVSSHRQKSGVIGIALGTDEEHGLSERSSK